MPYSTLIDVRRALTPGADPLNTETAAGLKDEDIQDAITQADATIDSYLASRYATPVAAAVSAPLEPFRSWSRNIAAYSATLQWREGLTLDPRHPIALRWADTMDQLTKVAQGLLTLPVPGVDQDQSRRDVTVVNPYDGGLFWPGDFSNVRPSNVGNYNQGRWPSQFYPGNP